MDKLELDDEIKKKCKEKIEEANKMIVEIKPKDANKGNSEPKEFDTYLRSL